MSLQGFELVGLNGANSLGFLAALGTLASLHRWQHKSVRLGWKQANQWVPVLEAPCSNRQELVSAVADALRGRVVTQSDQAELDAAQKTMEKAKTELRKKDEEIKKEIKKRGLRGAERDQVVAAELEPLRERYEEQRRLWLECLKRTVPSPELALGKRLDCTPEEYRVLAEEWLGSSDPLEREALDLLAAFGSDGCVKDNSGTIQATPFCFTTGSGHQFFLETVRLLMAEVQPDRIERVLFTSWDYGDEGLSLRWDPTEDRRYALMDRDPTASGNEVRTMWMANLLAYRALALFPTAFGSGGLRATGWDDEVRFFTWPLWREPIPLDVVRSLLQAQELVAVSPHRLSELRARGIEAVYRAERIAVGSGGNRKLNFTPSRRIA
jgi:hypothetical protein